MKSRFKRSAMATALLTAALATTATAPDAAAEPALTDQAVRALFNTAVSYHYHAKVRRKSAGASCYFDPEKRETVRCSWRWNNPGADAFKLYQAAKRDAVKWCKNAGGKSCTELYRNGKIRYEGLAPDERQRLTDVLDSIPSYDSESAPLPDGMTVEAGLFHERFAQMEPYWKDWRRKKKAGRNYAMCADPQGSGVRFNMQGEVKQLPHVRAMCILQCQAVAQWEGTSGQCYIIFENDDFTSTAARQAMQLTNKPGTAETRDAFVGTWKGIGPQGITIETVIERVDEYGRVTGTGCSEYRNGSLSWRTLDKARFVNGDRITLMNGNVRMALMMNEAKGGAGEIIQTWPSGWQRRAPMESMNGRGCNERFTVGAIPDPTAEPHDEERPIVGAWSGRWNNGNLTELTIDAIGPDGTLIGRYCAKRAWGMQLWDVGPDDRFKGTVDKKGRKAEIEIPWGNGNLSKMEFRLKKSDKVTMKHRERAGTNREKVSTLEMARGASVGGCLINTTRRPTADQG